MEWGSLSAGHSIVKLHQKIPEENYKGLQPEHIIKAEGPLSLWPVRKPFGSRSRTTQAETIFSE